MAKTLEAHDKLIREIFEGSYQFEIPDYQRPYSWTTEQTTELFDDLYSAMQDARMSGASSQYFLGSIVLIKNDRDPKSSVVDGQQRLSTLTMFFAVFRTVMPTAADDITDFLYKKGKISFGEKNEYRLTAREEDADFFRTNIQVPGGIAQLVASIDKLKDSRLRYREKATLLFEKAKALPPAELIALWKFLTNDCSLVVISTPELMETDKAGIKHCSTCDKHVHLCITQDELDSFAHQGVCIAFFSGPDLATRFKLSLEQAETHHRDLNFRLERVTLGLPRSTNRGKLKSFLDCLGNDEKDHSEKNLSTLLM